MPYVPLTELLKTWRTTAKSINVHLLAISAVIKKLAILSMENEVFDHKDEVKKFVLFSVTERFNKLLVELDTEWQSIVSTDFANSLEYAIHIAEIEISKMIDDDSLEARKRETEFAKIILEKIDQLRQISLVDTVLQITESARNMSKLSIVNDMLEDKLELRFTLPLLREDE